MNAPERVLEHGLRDVLPDMQSAPDRRQIPIHKVGVRGIRHPIQLRNSDGSSQPSIAEVEMTVALPEHVKGTHMSRFLEVLDQNEAPLDAQGLDVLLDRMLTRLQAAQGSITVKATYFRRKVAPVSGVSSLLDYGVTLQAKFDGQHRTLHQTVEVPVTSLCPCSKEISDYGAHNQRSIITVGAQLRGALSLDALIAVAENAASCQLWGLLKRPDEKYVTEYAYDHPKFVEDLVRDVALGMQALPEVAAFTVASENFESIHNHSAYAWLEGVND
jgi:GTP cyclohydrolase FolE2